MELLKEVVPGLSRVGILWDAANGPMYWSQRVLRLEARALKLQLQSLEVRGPNPDFEGAFQLPQPRGAPDALITVTGGLAQSLTKDRLRTWR